MNTEQPIPLPEQNPAQSASDKLFANERRRFPRAGTIIGTTIIAGVSYAGARYGIDPSFIDSSFVPEVDAVPEIVDGFVATNEGMRTVAPAVLAGGLTAYAVNEIRGDLNPKQKTINELSKADYSGSENVVEGGKKGKRLTRIYAGAGVAALTVLLTGSASGVEHEISEGPLRPIERVYDTLAPGKTDVSLIVQDRNTTLMADSYIDGPALDRFDWELEDRGIEVTPFSKSLPNIDGRSGMVISIPDSLFKDVTGVSIDDSCEQVPIILDEASTAKTGDEVMINNQEAQVIQKMEDAAQMNRDVAIMGQTDLDKCFNHNDDAAHFGAIVSGASTERINDLLNDSELGGKAIAVEGEQFKDANKDFWRKNGTPILLQMIAYIGAFGALATASERRGAMQRNIREIATLNAQGVSMGDIGKIERRRAVRETVKATALAIPAMPIVAGAFNAAEVGLRVGVGVREVAVGFSVALAAKVGGSMRAVRRFSKKTNIAEATRN